MRTLTLSQSVLGAHSLVSHSKSFKPDLQNSHSDSKKQSSKLSKSTHNTFPSSSAASVARKRHSRYRSARSTDKWFHQSLLATCAKLNGSVLRPLGDDNHCEVTTDSSKDRDRYILDTLPEKDHLRNENEFDADSDRSDASFAKFLSSALVLGLVTLQGSKEAIAASELSGGLQSTSFLGDLGDISTGFASAFLLIFFSELGDKTFFIAALLAARNSAAIVFVGTFGALAGMTIISVILGRTFHYVDELLPFRFGGSDLPIDDIAAVCLLVYFGVSTLLDASSNDGLKAENEQKEAEIAVSEFSGNGSGILAAASTALSTFLLVFVAEWGDKSFFSTIALSAASSPLGVIGGALAGHGVATLLAVLGGSLLGTFLSEKVIAFIGGVLFLVFAAVTLAEIVA